MVKNIVICCDGTGNEIEINLSNVLKLYRCLTKDATQVVYYDTGIGTINESSKWHKYRNKVKSVFGLMTGAGLDKNVLDAYRFLVQNYKNGDRVYLFGFSRGAYTVRVLAGFLRVVGLLKPDQENLFKYALASYYKASEKEEILIGWRLNKILESAYIPIKFIGVWDTVSSVIVPGIYPRLQILAFTKHNELVEVFRHAISIDERRRMFRADHWDKSQLYKSNPFMKDDHKNTVSQNSKQVWFSGVHSDVGGGYSEEESQLAKFPLRWMMDEAKGHDLKIKTQMYNHLANGKRRKGGNQNYVAPDPKGILHKSLTFWWWPMEIIPKFSWMKDWPKRRSFWGLYLPFSEPRFIEDGASIHSSVFQRIKDVERYDPENVPPNYVIEP